MSDQHVHQFRLPEGGYMVVATNPPQYPYHCECGAFTHNPETGVPCRTCAVSDFNARTTDLVRLEGGHLDGTWIPRPLNRSVCLRIDSSDHPSQMFDIYKPTENRDIWKFYANDWTQPVVVRDPPEEIK